MQLLIINPSERLRVLRKSRSPLSSWLSTGSPLHSLQLQRYPRAGESSEWGTNGKTQNQWLSLEQIRNFGMIFHKFFQTLCLFSLSSKARQDGEGAKAASGGLIQTIQLQPGKAWLEGSTIWLHMATSTWRILIHFHNMGPVTGKNPRNMADACQPG